MTAPSRASADVTVTLQIAGEGAHLQWTPSTGTTHHTLVNQSSCGSAGYNATSLLGARDAYRLSLWMIPMGATITSIEVTPCLAQGVPGSSAVVDVFYRAGGVDSAPSGALVVEAQTPSMAAPTTFSGLSILRQGPTVIDVGLHLSQGIGEARVSGLIVRVTYVEPPSFPAPSALAATVVSASQIALAWTSNTGGAETGFRIERATTADPTYTLLTTANRAVTTYADLSVMAGQTYSYRVQAINTGTSQRSDFSNIATATPGESADAGVPEDSGPPDSGVLADAGAAPASEDVIEVAITVDDFTRYGPEIPGMTREQIFMLLMNTLRDHQVPGAYGFVNAGSVGPSHRPFLTAWLDAGYLIGNHTHSHPNIRNVGTAAYIDNIIAGEPLLQEMLPPGDESWKVFRYTFGQMGVDLASRDQVKTFLDDRGYRIAWSTIEWGDWAWADVYGRCTTPEQVAALRASQMQAAAAIFDWAIDTSQALFGRQIKHVVTTHVGGFTAVTADELLTYFESRGVRFISLDEALSDPVYTTEPPQLTTWDRDFLMQVRNTRRRFDLPAPPAPPQIAGICP